MNPETNGGTTYSILIRERLDDGWSDWFEGMSLTCLDDGTLLTGNLPDQAALHGMLGRVQRLGLHLVSISEQDKDKFRSSDRNPFES